MSKFAMSAMLFCLSAVTPCCAADQVAASITTVQGSCLVHRTWGTMGTPGKSSAYIPATQGMHLLEQDSLITGSDGHLAVIMRDGTRLSLGPNTELRINQFTYDPGHGKFALVLEVTRGILAYVSGKIAKFAPDAVKVQTPVGAIAVRGTKFVVGLGVAGDAR